MGAIKLTTTQQMNQGQGKDVPHPNKSDERLEQGCCVYAAILYGLLEVEGGDRGGGVGGGLERGGSGGGGGGGGGGWRGG